MGRGFRGVLKAAAARTGLYARGSEKCRRLVLQGNEYLAAGRFEDALAIAGDLRTIDLYEAWHLKGRVLGWQHPHDDLTDFWKAASAELPRNAPFVRRHLDAALTARRIDEAEGAMAKLVASGKLQASDADYAIGLANTQLADGNRDAARKAVSDFLSAMRGRKDEEAARLRLSRIQQNLEGGRQTREQLLTSIRSASLPEPAADTLVETIAFEQALEAASRNRLFDTDVSRAQCEEFVNLVREHLRNATPFSFIRLGDGESNALGYPARFADQFDDDASERETIWWGRPLDRVRRKDMGDRVRAAIEQADALGIPTLSRILRDVRLDKPQAFSDTRAGRGLLAVMEALKTPDRFNAAVNGVLTSAHLHQDLERWGLYPQLLSSGDEAVVVSCHPRLPEKLLERFGVRTVHHIVIPPRHHSRGAFAVEASQTGTLADSVDAVIDGLGDWPKGRLVLVGAGYAGKIVIAEAKRRGGIALDLGSIFDHWMGARTRSYQDLG
ncbi:MAG TPA: hypothetical protein VLV55_02925 [Rhizomicrobium sp.]|nr:hypothetical protein [Rhizomicrobium sp.]